VRVHHRDGAGGSKENKEKECTEDRNHGGT
jgi:hypothetical protein